MRRKWRLNQNWYFKEEDVIENLFEKGSMVQLEEWERVTIPHSFRLEPYAHRGITTAQGIGTYVNLFSLEKELEKKHLFLTFEAVMGVSEVWLNGVHLHTNYGGYLPFVVYLNEAAYFDGRKNQLVVLTNNQDNGQVPPGKPQELLDFTYFGGIYRDIWLEAVEDVHITNPLYEKKENQGGIILEYPLISQEKAIVNTRIEVQSRNKMTSNIIMDYKIIDRDGENVAQIQVAHSLLAEESKEIVTEIILEDPFLWNLTSPHLYQLQVAIYQENELLDYKEIRFGLRKIEVDREKGVLINGEVQSFLSGVNRHQDYPIIGNAAPISMQRRDAILFKEAGFQVVRGAHYPMSESFLDACDELGLLVFEATPGWQWYPTNNPEPFTSRVRDDIRQMVRRDRNHPCILAYETVLNETYHVPHGFSRESARVALAEQPDGKVSAESYGYDASPEANGVDEEAEFVYGFQEPLEKTKKAVMFLREYTDSYLEYYGNFDSRRVTRGTADGFYPSGEARNLVKANQMLFRNLPEDYSLARCYQIREENPAFVGAAIWTGIDSRGAGSFMSPCGIWDGYRLPKTSYWAYASQQDEKKMLYIASEWTEKAPILDKSETQVTIGSDDLREVYVYSNVESVCLSVEKSGEVIWEQTATPYLDEGAHFLPHPPFYFSEVPYEKGTILRGKGLDSTGAVIIEDLRQTASQPHQIRIVADTLGIPLQADGNDLVLVRGEILDENGILCPTAEQKIYFEIDGDAKIVGDGDLLVETNPAWSEAGIASIYVKAGETPGNIRISATGKDLLTGSTELKIIPPVDDIFMNSERVNCDQDHKGQANLSEHKMDGTAEYQSSIEVQGNIYPESILLKGTTRWELKNETYFKTNCFVSSGDKNAELLIYLDNVLRWKGNTGDLKITVEGAKEMRMEINSAHPTEVLLLSPYLWHEKTEDEATELSENIAFGKPVKASVNPESAKKVWGNSAWFGKNPRDGIQEWSVDLERNYDIRNVKVQVGGQMGSDCTFYDYEIHTSTDGEHWTKQTENHRTSWSNGVLDYFTAENVRYIKVVFTSVDGRLFAGIQKFEVYEDYGVDSVDEYALAGIIVRDNILVFDPNCLEYHLPRQASLTIQALAFDPQARVSISGVILPQLKEHKITEVSPITVAHQECDGLVEIKVNSASSRGTRIYKIYF